VNFHDRIVFVSGANRGIGAALVRGLLQRGVKKVYAAARDPSRAPAFDIKRVVSIALDITNEKSVADAAHHAADTEVLINNAGVASYVTVLDGDMVSIRRDMETIFFGTLNMMRAFVPIMERNRQPTIINMNSFGSFVHFPILGGYCAAKAALFSITQGARIQLAERGFKVHSIHPGAIDTDMTRQAQIVKTSPQEAVESMFSDLETDRPDIFPDRESRQFSKVLGVSYSNLERLVADAAGGGRV
jgi:NAD(P)-dependent dehydrogenase (short-subunit alcohol dehydrogenase family)